jgi:predicted dehydrogenase
MAANNIGRQFHFMKPNTQPSQAPQTFSRRGFLRSSSLALAGAAALSESPFVITSHAAADDPIRIGVIGCGGRGTGAVLDALGAATKVIYPSAGYHTEDVAQTGPLERKDIKVVALADVFADRLKTCREQLRKLQVEIQDDMCFTGFDAYKKLCAVPDVNYVILAEPPHFRAAHLQAAIEAGKNVFMEKPVAVDAPGARLVISAGELAKQKGLGIAAGTQRRHMRSYQETIKRLQDGAIGEIQYGRVYWNGGTIWVVERQPDWTDMEWQLRNWNYFTWLSGDHICEQHVHNIDIANWVLGGPPIKAYGQGGRQARQHPIHGHIWDHFAVEYEYANGVRVFSQCRQMSGTESRVQEDFVGVKGSASLQGGRNMILPKGGERWRFTGPDTHAYQQEHQDLIASIRAGKPINEAKAIAESTLTAIMGRESAYSGQVIEWEQALASKTRLGPEKYEFGPLPFPEVPMPGKHKFV